MTTGSSTDSIRKEIVLQAPLARVWRALTDSAEFGEWFGVMLEGPFRVGERIQGKITHPGHEHMTFVAWVESMEPEQRFAYRWHPSHYDPEYETSDDPSTLVEFRLEELAGGTKLTVTESGFDAIPEERRHRAFMRNEGGWTHQVQAIKSYVDG